MTEQEQEALEQAAKPQRWGSKERVALVAEVLRQKRMVEWLCEQLRDINDDLTGPPYCPSGECSCDCQLGCAECWRRAAEKDVKAEWSEKLAQRKGEKVHG